MSGLHIEQRPGGSLLRITGELGIYSVTHLRQSLLVVLHDHGNTTIELDLSGVDETDSAGIQWLVSAAHQVRQEGSRPVCIATSEIIERIARRLGAADDQHFCGWELQAERETHHG